MNKRGFLTMELMLWILRIIVLTILIFSISFMIRKYMVVKVDVSNSENLLLVSFLQKTPALYHVDEITGLTSRGIIELSKFQSNMTEDVLYDSIFFGQNQRQISANISLFNDQNQFINEVIYNRPLYEDLKIKVQARGIWKKAVKEYTYKQPIIIKKGNQLKNGNLIIEVLKE